MAQMDFTHNVSEVPAGEALPKTYERHTGIEVTPVPDYQSGITKFAADTNWMSLIGSTVAQKSSQALATKLGAEMGKNPHGSIGLGVPITDFDKTMMESYRTQAQSTLALQADKLITDSNLAVAKADKITPDLIQKSQQSITQGLKNIYKNAPAEIQPHLELQFGQMQLDQAAQLTGKMIKQQHVDRINNTALASQKDTENAYSFGLTGTPQSLKAGEAAVEATRRRTEADVASRLLSPQDAKAKVDAARQSLLSGRIVHDYEAARTSGNGESFLKSIADKKPDYLSDADYKTVTQNLMRHVQVQNGLRSQDEQLRLAQFATSIAMNPMAPDMPQQLQSLKSNVSADAYQKAQLYYIEKVKAYNKQNGENNQVLSGWGSTDAFPFYGEKAVNNGYIKLKNSYMQQAQQQGKPVSEEEAEVAVVASAGGIVPAFRDAIKNELNSSNPQMMEKAALKMDALYSMNASKALAGLSDSDKSIYTQYKSLRDSLPPEDAAKIAIQNANQDSDIQTMNKQKWASYVTAQSKGTPHPVWALKQVGISPKDFINTGTANAYGNLIFNKYATFYQNMNGDQANALKLTQQEVAENFDWTGVNGNKVKTLHPIEKVLGYEPNGDVVPFIQQDALKHLNDSFIRPIFQISEKDETGKEVKKSISMKEAFGKKITNEYWDIVPKEIEEHTQAKMMGVPLQFPRAVDYNPKMQGVPLKFEGKDHSHMQVKRYTRDKNGVHSDTYNVILQGNSFNWDVSVQTGAGIFPLPQIAPYLGIQTYTPDKKAIDAAYQKSRNH